MKKNTSHSEQIREFINSVTYIDKSFEIGGTYCDKKSMLLLSFRGIIDLNISTVIRADIQNLSRRFTNVQSTISKSQYQIQLPHKRSTGNRTL